LDFDIALFLVILSFVTGVIWLIDSLFFAKKRQQDVNAINLETGETEAKLPLLVDYSRSLFPVFFIVLILRSFIFEPFRIPSQSMMPTLWVGDFILVNKFAYGVRLPVLNTEIYDTGKPERGDVAVFRFPNDPSINYIKRVIGVPGDKISYSNKKLTVNGKLIPESYLGRYSGQGSGQEMNNALYKNEDLLGVKHKILQREDAADYTSHYHPSLVKTGVLDLMLPMAKQIDFVVPEGQYFVMGDNRDNSNDSRYWGTVPVDNLVGEAFMIWFSWDAGHAFFWNRIGTIIK